MPRAPNTLLLRHSLFHLKRHSIGIFILFSCFLQLVLLYWRFICFNCERNVVQWRKSFIFTERNVLMFNTQTLRKKNFYNCYYSFLQIPEVSSQGTAHGIHGCIQCGKTETQGFETVGPVRLFILYSCLLWQEKNIQTCVRL